MLIAFQLYVAPGVKSMMTLGGDEKLKYFDGS